MSKDDVLKVGDKVVYGKYAQKHRADVGVGMITCVKECPVITKYWIDNRIEIRSRDKIYKIS